MIFIIASFQSAIILKRKLVAKTIIYYKKSKIHVFAYVPMDAHCAPFSIWLTHFMENFKCLYYHRYCVWPTFAPSFIVINAKICAVDLVLHFFCQKNNEIDISIFKWEWISTPTSNLYCAKFTIMIIICKSLIFLD